LNQQLLTISLSDFRMCNNAVLELLIEKLAIKDGNIVIGISENKNSKGLDVDALLKIAKSLSKSVLAFQFFNSMMIVDEIHLLSGAQNAINALKGDYMISRTLDVELAVFVSAQHQIGRALEIVGIKDELSSVGVVCIDEDEKKVRECIDVISKQVGEEITPVFKPTSEKIRLLMKNYGISELEMKQFSDSDDILSRNQALSKCVVSRVSQVSIGS
jgi:tRNA threonylcarbamoyladenosine modification (KEOPS) complex Cgi121 subunit